MVVDDDTFILDLLTTILTVDGRHTIDCMVSPVDAIRALSKNLGKYDCLIFDIIMPEMNGIELCRLARSMPELDNTPILMLTAKRETKYLVDAMNAGASDYITKPFEVAEIDFRMNAAIHLHSSRRNMKRSNERKSKGGALGSTNSMTSKSEIMSIFADELYRNNKK